MLQMQALQVSQSLTKAWLLQGGITETFEDKMGKQGGEHIAWSRSSDRKHVSLCLANSCFLVEEVLRGDILLLVLA